MIIQHWILLVGCWQYPNRSPRKAVKTIPQHIMSLALALASGLSERLEEVLETIQRCLAVGCKINEKRNHITINYYYSSVRVLKLIRMG